MKGAECCKAEEPAEGTRAPTLERRAGFGGSVPSSGCSLQLLARAHPRGRRQARVPTPLTWETRIGLDPAMAHAIWGVAIDFPAWGLKAPIASSGHGPSKKLLDWGARAPTLGCWTLDPSAKGENEWTWQQLRAEGGGRGSLCPSTHPPTQLSCFLLENQRSVPTPTATRWLVFTLALQRCFPLCHRKS